MHAPLQRGSTPSAVRHGSPLIGVLSALGLTSSDAPAIAMANGHSAVLATLTGSETFRWLRRWAVVAVVAIITPLSVITAFANQMPDFHHVAVPIAVAIVVPAWVLELSGVRWPRFALIAATRSAQRRSRSGSDYPASSTTRLRRRFTVSPCTPRLVRVPSRRAMLGPSQATCAKSAYHARSVERDASAAL